MVHSHLNAFTNWEDALRCVVRFQNLTPVPRKYRIQRQGKHWLVAPAKDELTWNSALARALKLSRLTAGHYAVKFDTKWRITRRENQAWFLVRPRNKSGTIMYDVRPKRAVLARLLENSPALNYCGEHSVYRCRVCRDELLRNMLEA